MLHASLRSALAVLLLALPAAAQAMCGVTSVGTTPINDLGAGTYAGFQGGLYTGGVNVRPAAHETAGLAQAAQIVPRDAAGSPSPTGKIVFMSVGMSNTRNEWDEFMPLSNSDPVRDPHVVVVQGAQGGVPANGMNSPVHTYWTTYLPGQLAAAGVTNAQVQAVWLKQAHSNPATYGAFPAEALALQADLTTILQILHDTFPNLRIAYLSSRIYSGYSGGPLNPEPYAYEGAFAVKWTIESQIAGAAALNYGPAGTIEAPWIAWGPYLWADGVLPRSDGLTWICPTDFAADGTHPNPTGSLKVANLLLNFMHTDTSAYWYRNSAPVTTSTPYCAGDGLDAAVLISCPCGNTGSLGNGCAHSFNAAGARLEAGGAPQFDNITFHGSGLPSTSFGLFMQHNTLVQSVFHDGVICAGGNLIRLRGRSAVGGQVFFPTSADTVTVSQRGQVQIGSGVERYYALFYRNASTSFCPPATANVTNGWRITW